MKRRHMLTHPHLGAATWKQIQAKRPVGCCSWCWKPVPRGSRTRCGRTECDELLWQVQSWNRCRQIALRQRRHCALCRAAKPTEVDHIKPVCLGGTGDVWNLRPLCHACHSKETARLHREGREYLAA